MTWELTHSQLARTFCAHTKLIKTEGNKEEQNGKQREGCILFEKKRQHGGANKFNDNHDRNTMSDDGSNVTKKGNDKHLR